MMPQPLQCDTSSSVSRGRAASSARIAPPGRFIKRSGLYRQRVGTWYPAVEWPHHLTEPRRFERRPTAFAKEGSAVKGSSLRPIARSWQIGSALFLFALAGQAWASPGIFGKVTGTLPSGTSLTDLGAKAYAT